MDPILLLIAAGMSVGLVVYSMGQRQRTYLLNRRARHRQAFREAFDLTERSEAGVAPGREPFEGVVEGFRLRVDILVRPTGGRLQTPGERETVRMRTELSGIFEDVEVRPETTATRVTADMPTGDADTDRDLFVVGPEHAVAAVMSAAGRVALRQAVRAGLVVQDGCLEGRLEGQPSASDMVELVQTLVRFTRRLERPESIAEALAENALSERRPDIRSRFWTLLLDRHRFGRDAAARQVALGLVDDRSLPEGRVRAAEFLRRDDVLLSSACDSALGADVRALALRALSELTPTEAPAGNDDLVAVFADPPADAEVFYFEQAVRALQQRSRGLETTLSEDFETHVIACLRSFGVRSEPLIRLLAGRGTVRAIPTLADLPRRLKRSAQRAIAAIQARQQARSGGLALVERADEGALSAAADVGAVSASSGLWALIPAKAFGRSKTRLSGVLSSDERAALSRTVLSRLLGELSHEPVQGIVVVTDSREVADVATRFGAVVQPDPPGEGLAAVLAAGVEEVERRSAEAVLVVMGDLPLFGRDDVTALVERLDAPDALVAAPDRHGTGVNAVVGRLPLPFELPFGREDSFAAHRRMAEQHRVQVRVHQSLGTGLDLDSPADLELWRAESPDNPRRQACP